MAIPGSLLDAEEIWRILFDGAKESISEPAGIVILLVLLSIAAMFLKERIKTADIDNLYEKYEFLFQLGQIVLFFLILGFLIWFFYGLYEAIK